MNGKPSARVAARIQTARAVTKAIDLHAPRVVVALAATAPALPGEVITAVLAGASATLKTATASLEGAEQLYAAEQADDQGPRERRDAATDAGVTTMQLARAALLAGLGAGAPQAYGVAGELRRDPTQVLPALRNAARMLNDKPQENKDAFGNVFSTAGVLVAVNAAAQALDLAMDGVATEARELQGALVDRDNALAAWQQAYVFAAGIGEHFFRLAGEVRLAEYLRPTVRKTTGEEAAAPEPPVPEPVPVPPVE